MPLKEILRDLLKSAEGAKGEVVAKRLAKGLMVRMMLQGEIVTIQLSRDKVVPAVGEWKALLACWPEPVQIEQEPKALPAVNDRHYLRGKLRRMQSLLKEENN